MAIFQGSTLQSNISTGAIGDINITHNSFIGGVVPDYVNEENSINRLPTPTSSWTVDRNGFIRIGGVTNIAGRIRIEINGQLSGAFTTNANQQHTNVIYAVKIGDIVRVATDTPGATLTLAYCAYIPPVQTGSPDPTKPHTWPTTGAEINFGDGTFGVRRVGNIVAAANTLAAVELIANLSSTGRLVDFGGGAMNGASAALRLGTQMQLVSNVATLAFTTEVAYSQTAQSIWFNSYSSWARAGTTNNAYDIWVRYTRN